MTDPNALDALAGSLQYNIAMVTDRHAMSVAEAIDRLIQARIEPIDRQVCDLLRADALTARSPAPNAAAPAVPIGVWGTARCHCDQGTVCPLGRVGSQPRCTTTDLVTALNERTAERDEALRQLAAKQAWVDALGKQLASREGLLREVLPQLGVGSLARRIREELERKP